MSRLHDVFQSITTPEAVHPDRPLYAVASVPGYASSYVGKDGNGRACLLTMTSERTGNAPSPIRLESLDVQFDLRCRIRRPSESEREGIFTVISCRVLEDQTVRYFLEVCETILRVLGTKPTRSELFAIVNRLAAIFQKIQRPPARPVNGLFAELYLIWRSADAVRSIDAWRSQDGDCFDFSAGDIRIEVKGASGKARMHTFSFEQCNPPDGTFAVVASILVAQAGGGTSLKEILDSIRDRIAGYPELDLKLTEVVAVTLGNALKEALSLRFDVHLAESSLRFFDARAVPAIRGALPEGLSEVHFRSDLSNVSSLSTSDLIAKDAHFGDMLPADPRH